MTELEKLEALKSEFMQLNEKEIIAFSSKMKAAIDAKSESELTEFVDALNVSAEAACEQADSVYRYVDLKLKLADVLEVVPMAYIAKNYFHKSRAWFSQRLNNHQINGTAVSFTNDELSTLSTALTEIGLKLQNTARSIA